nr:putative disease resistance RPP13-like protein 1 [Quercus suber]
MLPTTSLVDESEVVGRNNDKKELISVLLTADAPENRIPVIAIVGIGGVGKTTLAQLLYNDFEVKGKFHLRAWAYVSEEFDVFKVTRTIYESVTQENCNVRDLNLLQIKLQEKLKEKRFLLILDNIWNEKFIDWDLLSRPLKNGASGSRIVVTTRNQHVATLMGAFFTYSLSHLSDEDCWSLFAKHAFWTSNYEGPFQGIGVDIVKKCKGLPLAAKTLGGLLQSKEEKEEWLRILNSRIWDLPGDNSILPALRLSYYYLPWHLKRCFNYCSMFPKGYEFKKDKLILLWMAEGFLYPLDMKTMEQLGREYFHELLSRSFFQQLIGRESCFVMHDLINDLALFTSGEFYCKFEDGMPSNLLRRERHFACLADQLDGPEKFKDSICKFKDLRTFLPLRGDSKISRASGISSVFCEAWLPKLKHLRVLSFSCYAITKLPDSLGELIHLRYLDLSQTLIAELPSSTCLLFNLQTLLLSGCRRLTVLPAKSLGLLINLRYFDLSQTEIIELPSSTCSLTNLQTLLLSKCHRLTVLPKEIGRLSNLRLLDVSETNVQPTLIRH